MTNLADKLAQLEKQRDETVANVHALNGAIQFCKQLMAEAEVAAPTTTDESKPE